MIPGAMKRPSLPGETIEEDFEMSRLRVVSDHRARFHLFEHVSRPFLLFMVQVIRTSIAICLASVFAFVPEIRAHVSSPFLMVLIASLSVAPTLAPTLLAICDLPIYAAVSFFATSIAIIAPVQNGAFIGALIFFGVFILNFAEFRPLTRKLASAIWFLTLILRFLLPTASGETLVTASSQLLIGLSLGITAALVAQLLPPLTATKSVNRNIRIVCSSMAASCRMIGDKFHRTSEVPEVEIFRMRERERVRKSVPKFVSSSHVMLHDVVKHEAVEPLHLHRASNVERAEALAARARVALSQIAASLPLMQVENPFSSLVNYRLLLDGLQNGIVHVEAARAAFVYFRNPQLDAYTFIQSFRLQTRDAVTSVMRAAASVLDVMADLPDAQDPKAHLEEPQAHLRESMHAARVVIMKVREALQVRRPELIQQPSEHSWEMVATYWYLLEMYVSCEFLLRFEPPPRFLPYSSDYLKTTASWWVLLWSPTTSLTNGVGEDYITSRALGVRLLSAFIISAASLVGSLFVLVPSLSSVFTRGTWATLTAIFVYNPSGGGATLRAARDRMLGIFVGSSYAFIVLLILKGTRPDQAVAVASPVGITAFVVVFQIVIQCLLQENLALAGAACYAVILTLYSAPSIPSEQYQDFVLDNFLMTFIGAMIVTVLSSVWFIFNSPRYQFFNSLGGIAQACGEILDASVNSLLAIEDESIPSPSPENSMSIPVPLLDLRHTHKLQQMEGLLSSMQANLDDINMEPTLWRPTIDFIQATRIVQELKACVETLVLMDMICARLLIDPGEVRRSELLHTSAIPQVIAMRETLSQALLEVREMISYALHPMRELPFGWRPHQISSSQRRLLETGLSTALSEGWLVHTDFAAVSSRPILSYLSFLLMLDRFSTQVGHLWRDMFHLSTFVRQPSIFFCE